MGFVCTQPPLLEPVSLSELKSMLRLDASDTSQDDVLIGLNMAARSWCETITRRRFVTQQWQLSADYMPGTVDDKLAGSRFASPYISGGNGLMVGIRYAFLLPFPPVQSIDLFTYMNPAGIRTTLTSDKYTQDLLSQPARLCPNFGSFWPVAMVVPASVQITYTLGFATPIQVTVSDTSTTIGTATFTSANVGQPISIDGVGTNGGTLNTIIQSVASGVGTLRDQPSMALTTASPALLVNYGNGSHFSLIKTAIKYLVSSWFIQRIPSFDRPQQTCIEAILSPVMDIRI